MTLRQRVKAHPAVRRTVGVARVSAHVRERGRFVARELARHGAATYRVGPAGLRARVRHGTEDVWILGEVFRDRLYEPPPEVVAALAPREPELRIADLGGHIGMFGLWALGRWPRARVHAVEADPANARTLAATIAASGLGGRWTAQAAAAGARAGRVAFRAIGGSGSRLAEHAPGERSVEVEVVDVLPLLADADLAKIDIEGSEWPLLRDARLGASRLAAIALEVHRHGAPGDDFEETAHGLLRGHGFTTAPIPGAPTGAAMLWAWRA